MSTDQKSFGDFQTPLPLAQRVCARLLGAPYRSILEPTCGKGAFLEAACAQFPGAVRRVGLDLSRAHLDEARARLAASQSDTEVTLIEADAFTFDYRALLAELPEPVLLVGNPPWVTSAEQGRRGSTNLPPKANFHDVSGLEARTGKANFDVAEWLLIRLAESLDGRAATMAMLVKTSTARRTLAYLWRKRVPVSEAELFRIDAARAFGVAVEACLLVLRLGDGPGPATCALYPSLEAASPVSRFGLVAGGLVADVDRYARVEALDTGRNVPWRSGIKHDCARILELTWAGGGLVNGLDEPCDVEPEHLFPLLKSTDLARGATPRRWLLVPQRRIGEDTSALAATAPKTHAYLSRNAEALGRRKSSIYRGRPPFSIFGVGPYTFAPWKVAISGLHKMLAFRLVGPHQGRPTLLDDTCYFLPFETEAEAEAVHRLLQAEPGRDLLTALIFWDSKRPITKEVLRRLDLDALGRALGRA